MGETARFDTPNGLAYDPSGQLFVADTTNAFVRVIDLDAGMVSTVPGTSFSVPLGLADDGHGTVYVSDWKTEVIYAIDLDSGVVTSVAGEENTAGGVDGFGALARFDGPAGLAWDADAGLLFIADSQNNAIRELDPTTQTVSTLAGMLGGASGSTDGVGASAAFSSPTGLAVDGAGYLYVIDAANGTIRRVNEQTGSVVTVMGTPGVTGSATGQGGGAEFQFYPGPYFYFGSTGFSVSLAFPSPGVFLVPSGSEVLEAQAATFTDEAFAGGDMQGIGDGVGTSAGFIEPTGLALDTSGHLYVADNSGNSYNGNACTIREVDLATANITTAFGKPAQRGFVDGIGAAASFNYPTGVVSDLMGTVYVADSNNVAVRQVDLATGQVTTLAPNLFCSPEGLALPLAGQPYAGTLFETDAYCDCALNEIDLGTGQVTLLAGGQCAYADGSGADAGFGGPEGLAFDGIGTLYVADTNSDTIRAVDIATATVTTVAGIANVMGQTNGPAASATFNHPADVALDGQGHLFVTDTYSAIIRTIDLAGSTVSTLAGNFGFPQFMTYDGQGHLLVADPLRGSIFQVDTSTGATIAVVGNGTLQSVVAPGPLPAELNGPYAISFGPNGSWLIVDQFENALLQVK